MRIAHVSRWLFILLCILSSMIGFFVIGLTGAFLGDALIVPSALLGIVAPPAFLIWKRRQKMASPLPTSDSRTASATGTTDVAAIAAPQTTNEAPQTNLNQSAPPAKTLERSRLLQPRFLLLAIGGGAIGWIFHLMNNQSHLPIKVFAQRDVLSITNVGKSPIQILDMSANDRPDCTQTHIMGSPHATEEQSKRQNDPIHLHEMWVQTGWGSTYSYPELTQPKQLKVGETGLWTLSCGARVVRVEIKTDLGTEDFTFK